MHETGGGVDGGILFTLFISVFHSVWLLDTTEIKDNQRRANAINISGSVAGL